MTNGSKKRSAGHKALLVVAVLSLVVGLGALALGIVEFGSAFMTPSSKFFADPEGTMDATKRDAFIGIVLFWIGGLVAPVGGLLAIVAGIVEMHWRVDRVRPAT